MFYRFRKLSGKYPFFRSTQFLLRKEIFFRFFQTDSENVFHIFTVRKSDKSTVGAFISGSDLFYHSNRFSSPVKFTRPVIWSMGGSLG